MKYHDWMQLSPYEIMTNDVTTNKIHYFWMINIIMNENEMQQFGCAFHDGQFEGRLIVDVYHVLRFVRG